MQAYVEGLIITFLGEDFLRESYNTMILDLTTSGSTEEDGTGDENGEPAYNFGVILNYLFYNMYLIITLLQ